MSGTMATTRSHPRFWLLGNSSGSLSMSRLPTSKDALLMVQHFHINEAQTITVSLNKACLKVKEVWDHAHIPTQRVDSCARKLSKLYHQYQMLKVNRNRQRESDIMKEQVFQADIEKLFDIATKDAMMTMVNLEDKKFLTMQRESVQSCSMASIDKELASLETRRQQRKEKESMAKARYEAREEFNKTGQAFHYDPSSSSSSSEEEYQPSAPIPSSSGAPPLKRSRKTDIIKSPVVIEAMDRTNLSDRNAVFVAGAVAQALGHDIADMSFSRSTIRRYRASGRKQAAETDRKSFSPDEPLLLHWDGKLLPDVQNTTASRIAIVVTFNGQEKLLGVPKKERETGEAQAEACLEAIKSWNVEKLVKGLVFDTTASNTGLHRGACVRIEDELEQELVWIACRHHVLEIMLSDVFSLICGSTGSLETILFKRFKKQWRSISLNDFIPAPESIFWHEAPMAVRAPFNDLQLMKVLKEYPHEKVAHAAQAAISRHLWYLSEHLIGLSLFDDRIDTETKKNMVQNFQCPKKQDFSRRIVLSDETPISNVASFVTERTLDIFDVLTLDGKERAQLFLSKDPKTWKDDEVFITMRDRAINMKVVNDSAERAIALIQRYNESITQNEDQKQYLLQVVAAHRKKLPTASKAAMMKGYK
ncbi:hypothetical protein Hamer_G007156 [Homarus americanus]|uniref:Uncharacterized protein n=1 Tax=Homarus americanus TaxID=6706 RepID=A0A8J5K2G3_HOMAM|nr:hypothetical protein Hamer_G007156 [Homarus americanus]